MNTDTGAFVLVTPETPENVTTLTVGEIVKVKGERFKVLQIKGRTCVLQLMSAREREQMKRELVDQRPDNRKNRRAAAAQARKAK